MKRENKVTQTTDRGSQRALAHIEQIAWIKPIEGADNIELIGVLGWVCIAKKGEFQVGDTCIYFEIDSKLPGSGQEHYPTANRQAYHSVR